MSNSVLNPAVYGAFHMARKSHNIWRKWNRRPRDSYASTAIPDNEISAARDHLLYRSDIRRSSRRVSLSACHGHAEGSFRAQRRLSTAVSARFPNLPTTEVPLWDTWSFASPQNCGCDWGNTPIFCSCNCRRRQFLLEYVISKLCYSTKIVWGQRVWKKARKLRTRGLNGRCPY